MRGTTGAILIRQAQGPMPKEAFYEMESIAGFTRLRDHHVKGEKTDEAKEKASDEENLETEKEQLKMFQSN